MTTIPLHLIEPGTRLRGADPEQVKNLAESIDEVGLLHPIAVYRRKVMHGGIAVDGYGIVAGLNRFEAHKALGRQEIEATVLDLDELHRQLAEVDENLAGTKLTPAERALFTRRRKEVYEALHPETKAAQNASKERKTSANSAFVSDTAEKSGVSRRTVEMDAARGSIGDDLSDLKGTSLDKGVELDALAKMDPGERADIVARAKAGERVTARRQQNALDDKMTKEDANERLAEWLAENSHGEQWATLSALIYAAGYTPLGKAFNRLVGTPVFDSSEAGR
jgi:ParB family transcriptional regulator, chromosome partitioning protein